MKLRTPSHGTVIAYLALFVALSGTAIAVQKNSIGTKALKKGAVKESKIADGAVTNPKLADSAVTGGKIADGSIGSGDLGGGSVTAAAIGSNAVLNSALANDSVGSPQIQPDAVTTGKILDSAVTSARIAGGAVATGKLADGAVTNPKLATDSVTGANVTAGSLPLNDLAVVSFSTTTGVINAGACLDQVDVDIPGKTAGDAPLVFPGSITAGWSPILILQGYGTGNSQEVDLRICNNSGGSFAGDTLPLRALLSG